MHLYAHDHNKSDVINKHAKKLEQVNQSRKGQGEHVKLNVKQRLQFFVPVSVVEHFSFVAIVIFRLSLIRPPTAMAKIQR